jgi:hypothetical protein
MGGAGIVHAVTAHAGPADRVNVAGGKMKNAVLWFAAVFVIAGCDALGIGRACTDVELPALRILLLDSATAAPLSAESVQVTATDGNYSDTAHPNSAGSVGLASKEPERIASR